MNHKIYIVTGCNSPYISSWKQLYSSIKTYLPNAIVYFFDLGLIEVDQSYIKSTDVIYNIFNFSEYEPWVNVSTEAGQ